MVVPDRQHSEQASRESPMHCQVRSQHTVPVFYHEAFSHRSIPRTQQAKSQQAPLFRKVCHQLLAPRSKDGPARPCPFEKAVFDLRRQLHNASLGLPPAMNVHNNIPSSGVPRQAAQRCTRGARLREARGPDATKRGFQGLGTMGQDGATCIPHLVVLITTGNRSVFRSECNTGTSRRSHIRRLSSHEAVTVSSCLNTPVISH